MNSAEEVRQGPTKRKCDDDTETSNTEAVYVTLVSVSSEEFEKNVPIWKLPSLETAPKCLAYLYKAPACVIQRASKNRSMQEAIVAKTMKKADAAEIFPEFMDLFCERVHSGIVNGKLVVVCRDYDM